MCKTLAYLCVHKNGNNRIYLENKKINLVNVNDPSADNKF